MTKDVAKFNSWIDPTTGERLYAQVTDDGKKSEHSAGHEESGDDGPIIREWYSRDHEHNIEAHSTAENARAEAEAILDDAREHAPSDGWPEQVEAISWGLLVPYGSVRETRTWEAEEGSSFDYMAEYALVPTGASEAQDAYASRLEDERAKLRSALCDVERLTRERDAALADAAKLREALRELVRIAEHDDELGGDTIGYVETIVARRDDLGIAPE